MSRSPQVGDVYGLQVGCYADPECRYYSRGDSVRILALTGSDFEVESRYGATVWSSVRDLIQDGNLRLLAVAEPKSLEALVTHRQVLPYKGYTHAVTSLTNAIRRLEEGRPAEDILPCLSRVLTMLAERSQPADQYLVELAANNAVEVIG